MMRVRAGMMLAAMTVALAAPLPAAPAPKKPPYFASIFPSRARMRKGPGKSYPVSWVYQRADLPVRVLDTYEHGIWVKVEDPDGTQGWMLGTLIKPIRTGIVMGENAELRASPRDAAPVVWRAAPGVVGRLSKCASGWCWFDVHGRGGYVEANRLWGVGPDEALD